MYQVLCYLDYENWFPLESGTGTLEECKKIYDQRKADGDKVVLVQVIEGVLD